MAAHYSRKAFLRLLGMGTVALAVSESGFSTRNPRAAPIGFQLYSIRREIESDFEGSIRKIAGMGFMGVETYPLPSGITLEQAASLFRESGLQVLGMHTELPIGDQKENVVRMAELYNCQDVVYPGWPQGDKYKDLEATKRTVETFSEVALFLKERGLRLGLHNHWWEFEKIGGIYPFYYLLENVSPDVFFEIDTYWAQVAGRNPAKVVADFGERAPFLHIKDGPATKGDQMYAHVPAGKGSVDFASIVKAGGDNIRWMIVEFDEYAGNIFEGLQSSYSYLTNNGLAKGTV